MQKQRNIYYESSFEDFITIEDESLIGSPFKLEFFTDGLTKYVASYDGEKFENCELLEEGSVIHVAFFKGHGLNPGMLKCKYTFDKEIEGFVDRGIQPRVAIKRSPAYLTNCESDSKSSIEESVVVGFASATLTEDDIQEIADKVAESGGSMEVVGSTLKFKIGGKTYAISGVEEIEEDEPLSSPVLPEEQMFVRYGFVEITSNVEGANIYYTTDGTDPTDESTLYDAPVYIAADNDVYLTSYTIKAIAEKNGEFSDVSTAVYTVARQLETPSISSGGTEYDLAREITIEAPEGVSVKYTIDGNNPTEDSDEYTAPFEITQTCVVKAISVKDEWETSDIISLGVEVGKVAPKPYYMGASDSLPETLSGTGTELKNTQTITSPTDAKYVWVALPSGYEISKWANAQDVTEDLVEMGLIKSVAIDDYNVYYYYLRSGIGSSYKITINKV